MNAYRVIDQDGEVSIVLAMSTLSDAPVCRRPWA